MLRPTYAPRYCPACDRHLHTAREWSEHWIACDRAKQSHEALLALCPEPCDGTGPPPLAPRR